MDTENSTDNHQPSIIQRLLLAVPPVLLIAVGYVDPGKWAAAVEGGVRFGSDLVFLMLVFNFAAIFCQYLSARIAVVTGRDLSKICSEEYDNTTCIFLGVLTELSLIALDFTMIMGAANELNLVFGADLFTSVFFTAIGAVIFPVLASILDNGKVKLVCVSTASFILLLYALGVLLSQPEISISTSLMPTKLSGDSVFALMSLLGANIIPHNFYLHSSLVQQELGPLNVSVGVLCHNQFFAILCIFSGLFLVNYALMNAAANMYYSTDFGSLTFQDALSLIQVFRSSTIPFAFLLVLYVSSQITSLTWNLGRHAILHDFFGMDIPGWLHHVTIRIIAIIPALYCVWNAGAEDIYQLLIVTQVVVALMLPSSVIPLLRVASSRSVMGVYKISQFVEFLAVIMFFGMLGLKIIFLVEMIFGNSYWDSNLRWNVGSYIVLLTTGFTSLCLMIWLAATPLKSASIRLDAYVPNWDIKDIVAESSAEKEKIDFYETRQRHDRGEPMQKQVPALAPDKFSDSKSSISVTSANLNLPEALLDLDNIPQLTTIAEKGSNDMHPSPPVSHLVEPASAVETVVVSTVYSEGSVGESAETIALNTKSAGLLVERTPSVEEDLQIGNDEEGHNWDPEESLKVVSGSSASLTSDGPGSYRSVSGKNDDSGSGAGSLSRLAGLGRAGRRQLAAFLDEFWGQLFDFHGQAAQESQAKKLDLLLGLDSKVDPKAAAPLKVTSAKEFAGCISPVSGKGFDPPINSSVYDSTKPLGVQDGLKTYVVQQGLPSSWSSRMQLLDAYVQNASHSALDSSERRYSSLRFPASSDSVQNSSHNALESSERRYSSLRFPPSSDAMKNYSYNCVDSSEKRYSSLQFPPSSDCVRNSSHNALDSSERRYSSLRFPPSSDINDYQPATVHGYQIASHLRQIAKESSDYLNVPMEAPILRSPSLGTSKYKDSIAFASGRKLQNGLSTPPGFSKPVVSRNISLQSERPFNDLCSLGPAENVNAAVNAKKFQSLPDISGLSFPFRDAYGQSLYSSISSRAGAPLAYDIRSPSRPYRDPYPVQFSSSSDTGSLWSTQPFEQYGVADKTFAIGGGVVGHEQSSLTPEITTVMDLEAKLLQSFRRCIMKLLKLEGSDWLFRQNDGADEDLIDRVAARERFLYEAETREMNRVHLPSDSQHPCDRKPDSALKNDETDDAKFLVSSVPQCGEGCVWRVDLIVSFGVWCIRRILELSLMESRPELWGKYTYVLNRLQGIIDLAFSKPRTPMTPCFCLQIPAADQQKLSPPISSGSLQIPAADQRKLSPTISSGSSLPPPARQGRGKCTTSAMLLDMIKDVEIAISCRKGRTGTAAGDVAFPKGKENLASVLKRYKRRLNNKPVGAHEGGIASVRISSPSPY